MSRGLLRAASWVFLGILVGRLLGFSREVLISRVFGVSGEADIAILVLTIPNVLLDLLIGGAMGAALVPEFVQRQRQGGDGPVYRKTLLVVGLSFVMLAAVLAWGARGLLALLAPGLEQTAVERTLPLIAISLASLPLTAMTAVGQARLHAHGRFAIASLATPLYNAGLIIPLLLVSSDVLIAWLPWFIISAALGRAVIILGVAGMCASPAGSVQLPDGVTHASDSLLRRYVLALAAGLLVLLLPILARASASWVGEGGIAIINYASKVIDLPLGACLTILSVVLLPHFSRLNHEEGGQQAMRAVFMRGIGMTLVLAIPITIGLYVFSEAVAAAILGTASAGIHPTAQAIAVLCWGIPAMAMVSVHQALLQARRDLGVILQGSMLAILPLLAATALVVVGEAQLRAVTVGWVLSQWTLWAWLTWALRRHQVGDWLTVMGLRMIAISGISLGIFAGLAAAGASNAAVVTAVLLLCGGICVAMLAGLAIFGLHRQFLPASASSSDQP